jgi:hypothetical protein
MQPPPRVAGTGRWTAVAGENFRDQLSRQEDLQSPMYRPSSAEWQLPLNSEQQLREAVLLCFRDPPPVECARLQGLSLRQWKPLLYWLDVSGLALYFLDRITELELCEQLPAAVLSRLQQNLEDNTARTDAMIAECAILHYDFQEAGLSYVTMKGFSLWPISVPRLELRSQLDLDFLMANSSATQARHILEAKGYHLRAISGRSWEFKTNPVGVSSIRDLYKAKPHRTVELHLETPGPPRESQLVRAERRLFHGACMPVLGPADLFLGQGMHLFKHICGSSFRTSHLIEFRRHVRARHHDDRFWMELRLLAERNPRTPIGLGVVILLISQVLGDFAPKALTCWTVDSLPAAVRLWVELYGRKVVFYDPPGSKLYLLLQQELGRAGIPAKRSLRQALLPRGLPHAIAHRAPGETPRDSIRRCCKQLHYIWMRLCFHTVEGLRYLRESARWQKRTALMPAAGRQRSRAS